MVFIIYTLMMISRCHSNHQWVEIVSGFYDNLYKKSDQVSDNNPESMFSFSQLFKRIILDNQWF